MQKIPPDWFGDTINPKKQLSSALDRLKESGHIVGEADKENGIYFYRAVAFTETQPETSMNIPAETLPEHPAESFITNDEPPERTLQQVAREFVIEVAAETVVSSEHLPASSEHLPPICSDLPADVETLTVYRVRGTDKCFETAAEVLGYRAELNRKRFAAKVADMWPGMVIGSHAVENIMDYIVACGGKIEIPEVSA